MTYSTTPNPTPPKPPVLGLQTGRQRYICPLQPKPGMDLAKAPLAEGQLIAVLPGRNQHLPPVWAVFFDN